MIREKRNIFILYGLFFLLIICPYLFYSKSEIHLLLTQYHSGFADLFFKWLTHLGNGFTVAIIGLVWLLFNKRYGFLILLSFSVSGILVQILKRLIFHEFNRPTGFFSDLTQLHIIDGVKMLQHYTFPSGHTSSAFALFFSIVLLTKSRVLMYCSFLMAVLVAYSRVYLSQHFLIDIAFGSLIAVITVVFMYIWIQRWNQDWLDKPFISSKKY